ncbi:MULTISPECIES: hypothetical protein [unclassified Exiguobacterium]|uniref:hypothetical protein n=1 Tax=unclassified Exiguobacterium TaxID=2644629 RepID=UPI001BE5B05D|nr:MULTISPECIES: hypothetical protein [unclassified Exiguobacterium]
MSDSKQVFIYNSIITVITYYLAVVSIFPPFQSLNFVTPLGFILMTLWVFVAFLLNRNFFVQTNVHTLFVFLFILITFIMPYLFGNPVIGNRYLNFGQVLFFYIMYEFNKANGHNDINEKIIKWTLPFIAITTIITLYNLFENPWISRSLKSNGDYSADLRIQGIGGYELVYFLVFLNIIAFFLLYNRVNLNLKFNKLLVPWVFYLLSLITILYANYFTALIMMTVGTLLIIITKERNLASMMLFNMFVLIFLFKSKEIFIYVTNIIISYLESGRTVERMMILQADIIGNGSNAGLLEGRYDTLNSSWYAFLENPLYGTITNEIMISNGFLTGFGQHSQILDTLALYGIVVGGTLIYIVSYPFFKRYAPSSVLNSLNFAMLVVTSIIFIMNNITPSIGFAIFFVYPTLYDKFSSKVKHDL